MIEKINNEFLVKDKNNNLLKVAYRANIGIYYEYIIDNSTNKKNIIDKGCFKYFYVFEDNNKDINLLYQNSVGDIILYNISKTNSIYSTLFTINKDLITPINSKIFYINKELIILYSKDNDPNKIYLYNVNNVEDTIIYNDITDINVNYNILFLNKYIHLIIYSISPNIFKLSFKVFNGKSNTWVKNRNIYISNKPYVDISFYISNKKLHSLIIEDINKKILIYKYNYLNKEEFMDRELIIYENDDISSCLITEINKVIWILWISNNNMYGCYSLDKGENFSKSAVYLKEVNDNIKKIIYIEDGINKETYIKEKNKEIIFLDELLKYKNNLAINYKEITYSQEDIEKHKNLLKKMKNNN